jgi:hypothetical protein
MLDVKKKRKIKPKSEKASASRCYVGVTVDDYLFLPDAILLVKVHCSHKSTFCFEIPKPSQNLSMHL